LLDEPSNLTVEALEPSRLIVLPFRQLEAFFNRDAAWQLLGRKLAEFSYLLRERHAYQLLALPGAERYRAFCRDHPNLVGRVPQKFVAGYLGLQPTSLNRLIAKERKQR
jgi:CRP-like cAMP-binding protein